MKTKLPPLLLLMFMSGQSFSQPYIPVLDNNPAWITTQYFFGGSQTFTISQNGEQTVGANTYKKFVRSGSGEEYLLREDIAAKKVYKLINNVDVLFFDFNLTASSNITLGGQNYSVISVSNININGGQRRQWYLNNNSPFGSDEVWIEGIGNNEHPLKAAYEMMIEDVYRLQCSSQNGEFFYNAGLANGGTATDCLALGVDEHDYSASKITFAPNPFQSELMISSKVIFKDTTLKMYNAIGELVTEMNHLNGNKISLNRNNLSSGLYLIDLFEAGKVLKSTKVLITN